MPDLDRLREVGQLVRQPAFGELLDTRRRRSRHTRIATASALATAVVVAVAALAASAGDLRGDPSPVAPSPSPTATPTQANTTRKLVYSDDLRPNTFVGRLQVGDREVEIDQKVLMTHGGWSLVVTDAGAAYVKVDHSVWVTDGGRPQKIAQQACADTSGDHRGLATGNAGTLVAWFDCSPASRGDLVVYDTGLGHEVARHPDHACRAPGPGPLEGPYECVPDAVIGKHVYFGHINRSGRLIDHQFRLDVTSGQVTPAGPAVYADDLRTHPRALVIGDSWSAGTPTNETGVVVFHVVGSRLVPVVFDSASDKFVQTRAFDTVTRQPVRLRLPVGYHPHRAAAHVPGDGYAVEGGDLFTPFEWLDDDTVALVRGGTNFVGDIITCHVSDGRCALAVPWAAHDRPRIAPGMGLPG